MSQAQDYECEPACRPAGVSGVRVQHEVRAEPRDQEGGAFARLGSRHMGLRPPLSTRHCAAGRGGLLRAQWTPCQPSAGPCPRLFRGPVPSVLHSPEPLHVES